MSSGSGRYGGSSRRTGASYYGGSSRGMTGGSKGDPGPVTQAVDIAHKIEDGKATPGDLAKNVVDNIFGTGSAAKGGDGSSARYTGGSKGYTGGSGGYVGGSMGGSMPPPGYTGSKGYTGVGSKGYTPSGFSKWGGGTSMGGSSKKGGSTKRTGDSLY